MPTKSGYSGGRAGGGGAAVAGGGAPSAGNTAPKTIGEEIAALKAMKQSLGKGWGTPHETEYAVETFLQAHLSEIKFEKPIVQKYTKWETIPFSIGGEKGRIEVTGGQGFGWSSTIHFAGQIVTDHAIGGSRTAALKRAKTINGFSVEPGTYRTMFAGKPVQPFGKK